MSFTLMSLLLSAQIGLVDRSPDHILDPENIGQGSLVGADVQLCGDFAFVAAPGYSGSGAPRGKVDIWKRCTTGYQLHQELHPSTHVAAGLLSLRFGYTIGASEDFLAVSSLGGIAGDFATQGLVHVFQLVDDQWLATDILRPVLDPFLSGTGFGNSLTIHDDELVVGATNYGDTSQASSIRGAVHIYDLGNRGRAHLQQTIEAPSLTYARFGYSSDLYDDVLVVSQPTGGGWVHVYRRSGSAWNLAQTLERPGGSSSAYRFGWDVSIDRFDGSIFISDSDGAHNDRNGTLYRYAHGGGGAPYTLAERFTGTEGSLVSGVGDLFGESFEVSGDVLAIGSQEQSVQGVMMGACELYRRGVDGWRFAGRFVFPHVGQPVPVFANEVAVDDGRVLVADTSWGNASGSSFGRCYIWEISSALEVCALPGDESSVNICRQADSPGVVDVTVSGLDFNGLVGLAVGSLNVAPGMSSGLCIQRLRRLAPLMPVTVTQSTAIFTDLSLDPNAGPGFAVQAFYLRSNSTPRLAIGPAVALFE